MTKTEILERAREVNKKTLGTPPEIWRGVPLKVSAHEDLLDVLVMLCPEGDRIAVKIVKEHATQEIAQVQMELDPSTMLLRWR